MQISENHLIFLAWLLCHQPLHHFRISGHHYPHHPSPLLLHPPLNGHAPPNSRRPLPCLPARCSSAWEWNWTMNSFPRGTFGFPSASSFGLIPTHASSVAAYRLGSHSYQLLFGWCNLVVLPVRIAEMASFVLFSKFLWYCHDIVMKYIIHFLFNF